MSIDRLMKTFKLINVNALCSAKYFILHMEIIFQKIYLTKIPCLLLLIDFIALAKCQIINVYNNVTLGPKIVLMIE